MIETYNTDKAVNEILKNKKFKRIFTTNDLQVAIVFDDGLTLYICNDNDGTIVYNFMTEEEIKEFK